MREREFKNFKQHTWLIGANKVFAPIGNKTNIITRNFPRFALIEYFPALFANELKILPRLAPGSCFPALDTHHVFWLRVSYWFIARPSVCCDWPEVTALVSRRKPAKMNIIIMTLLP